MTQPKPGAYAWHVGTLRDGMITTQLPMVQSSWSDVMDDAAPLSGTVPLGDPDVAALRPYLVAEPCRCFLAVAYTDPDGNETFLAGGPIWTHSYDGAAKKLTVGAAGLWSYYDHRKVLPVLAGGASPANAVTAFTSSLGTIAKGLVALAHTHTAGALPVVLPADEAGANVRNYLGFEMNGVGQMLRELTGVQGGPEIQFVPRRRADDGRFLEWVMRVGTAAAPLLTQTGDDWVWDASAAKSSVSGISVQRDGSAMGSRAWAQGSGTDVSTLFARADDTTLLDAGFPLLENLDTAHSDVVVPATLAAYAAGDLAQSLRPVQTWTITVRRDDLPRLGSYRVGDWVSLTVAGDPYLPDGIYRTRILSVAGDDGLDVTIQLAPTPGGI